MNQPLANLVEKYTIHVEPNQKPCRLDHFLVRRIPAKTRTRLQTYIRQKAILVNSKEVKPSYQIKPQDTIQVFLPAPQHATILPQALPLDIVYEDDCVLAVNKKAGMVVHPGLGHWENTLVNGLIYHFQALPYKEGNEIRPGLLHRLDKGTSGLVLVAKTEQALNFLSQQFTHRTIHRVYWALAWGCIVEEEGTIRNYIGRSMSDRKRMAVYHDAAKGKEAITHYRVLERFGYVTLIECRLQTGRTHQIRVQLKSFGHPIFGDSTYGGNRILKGQPSSKYKSFVHNCFSLLPHQALHAKTLHFLHPSKKEHITLATPLPKNFLAVIEKWRRYTKTL